MRTLSFTIVAVATILLGSTLWTCNKDMAESEPAETTQAQEQASPTTMPAAGEMQRLRVGCPMVVQGADVAVSDTEGGIALTFTTDAGDVGDLRARVQSMARMYQMHRGHQAMIWHHMGGKGMGHGAPGVGMDHMGGRGPMPAASTTVTDTDKGARLELRATDASQLDALREQVRWHQQRMHSGECWMLQGPSESPSQGAQE